jgi:hypothetical protein
VCFVYDIESLQQRFVKVLRLERQEAIEILWDILNRCPSIDQNPVCLIPSTAGMLAEGFQIHIAATICDEARKYLREVLARYGVEYIEKNERFMIYKRVKTEPPI